MTASLTPNRDAAERVIAQITARPLPAGDSPPDIISRINCILAPALIRALADEADAGRSREEIDPAIRAVFASMAISAGGFLGEEPGEYRIASSLLIDSAARLILRNVEFTSEVWEAVPYSPKDKDNAQ